MISYENIEVTNLFTEGFELSLPSAMTVLIGAGILTFVNGEEIVAHTFEDIEFDIESDEEVAVQYDVYLLSSKTPEIPNVSVNRTEIGIGNIAAYEGDVPLVHVLLSFTVPPNTSDLGATEFTVRNIVHAPKEVEEEEDIPDEVQAEE